MEVQKFPMPMSLANKAEYYERYAAHVHELNRIWWYDEGSEVKRDLNIHERFQLVLSEVAEAMEGFRKDLQDDHLPQYKSLHVELADGVIRILDMAGAYSWRIEYGKVDTLVRLDEPLVSARLLNLSDFAIRMAWEVKENNRPWLISNLIWHFFEQSELLALATACSDFWQVVYDKLIYNRTRADHSYAARAQPHGKKF